MKLTITIEEDTRSEVRVERVETGATKPVEERHPDVAAVSAGGPPEWLVAELQEGRAAATQETASAEMPVAGFDAGPAPGSSDGLAELRR